MRMTAKRFEYKNHKVYDNLTGETHSSNMVSVNVLNELAEENEQLKQHKQSVSDVLLSWSQKNLTAKQLQVVIAIMEELNILGDFE